MFTAKKKNLLIICAGDNSLHTLWTEKRQTFDVICIYYGSNSEKAELYKKSSDLFFQQKGLKISLARKILLQHLFFEQKFDFSSYAYIWFPDDDLKFYNQEAGIEELFEIAELTKADVFQPAIQNEYFSVMWAPTRLIKDAYAHRTNIVEIMAHGFSGEAFVKCYLAAIHLCDFMQSGWGVEPLWMKIGEVVFRRPLRTFVFDVVPVIHTRPIGTGNSMVHLLGMYEATYIPQIITNRMKTYSVYKDLTGLLVDDYSSVDTTEKEIEIYHKKKFRQFIHARKSISERVLLRIRNLFLKG